MNITVKTVLLLIFFMVVCGYADKPRFDNEDDDESSDNKTDGYKSTKTPKEQFLWVRVGLNWNSAELFPMENADIEGRIGGHLGVISDMPITQLGSSKLYLQYGFMLSTKGAVIISEYVYEDIGPIIIPGYYFSYYYDYKKTTYTIKVYCIEVPGMFSLKIPLTENLSLRANAGVYADIGISGTLEKEVYSKYEQSDPSGGRSGDNWDFDSQDIYPSNPARSINGKYLNTGMGIGFGLEYGSFYFGTNYYYGITNVVEYKNYSFEAHDRTVDITFGYKFY